MAHFSLGNNIEVYHGIENTAMLLSRQSEAPRDLAQGRRSFRVGCDEGNFSFPEESLFTRSLCEIALTAT